MRQFVTIATNAFMELIRQPVFLLLMTVSAVFEIFLATPYYFAFGDEPKLVKNSTLAVMRRIQSNPVPSTGRNDVPDSLERLLRQRRGAYESADAVVDTELYELQKVIEKVVQLAPGVG